MTEYVNPNDESETYPQGLVRWISTAGELPPFVVCECSLCSDEEYKDACLDPWTLWYLAVGILTGLLAEYVENWAILITFFLFIFWKLFENTVTGASFVATMTCSKNFIGENLWNSLFDILAATGGSLIGVVVIIST